jgi:predicted CXXCH cytochrome family protein
VKVIVGLGLVSVALLAWGGWGFLVEPAVRQPIEFPHKTHLELKDPKFECMTCHDRAEKSPVAGRPSTKKCLSCHSAGEAKSAEERKLQAFGEEGGEIPWKRVWRLPSHVFFSHRTHVAVAKVKCQTCHGPMETLSRPPGRALKKLTMNDCIGCHEQWEWPKEKEKGMASVKVAAVRRVSTDCNACHR